MAAAVGRLKSAVLGLIALISVMGCASGHCYGRRGEAAKKIYVFKPDGSKQCEKDTGDKVEVMVEQLKGIKIFSQENKSDGLNHMMMCGAATGRINVYQIFEKDLPVAEAAGFKKLE